MKKSLSILLLFCMLLGMFSSTGFVLRAADEGMSDNIFAEEAVAENENIVEATDEVERMEQPEEQTEEPASELTEEAVEGAIDDPIDEPVEESAKDLVDESVEEVSEETAEEEIDVLEAEVEETAAEESNDGTSESVSYRKPIYNTAGDATSGIASWTTEAVSATILDANNPATVWGTSGKTTWYAVKGTVAINESVVCNGTVNLILTDGCQLTVSASSDSGNAGIRVSGTGTSLTIYAQSTEGDMGTLTAVGACASDVNNGGGAGIGGNVGESGNNITIHGGTINSSGGGKYLKYGAGIGSGYSGDASNIIINEGAIDSKGIPGIGGQGTVSKITINDGTVDTNTIGGGTCSDITINGGTITAAGNSYYAGIGSGQNKNASNIKITGGTVTVRGGAYSAGIGGGCGSDVSTASADNITISGGTVIATSGGTEWASTKTDYASGAGIGGGSCGNGTNITISGGTVIAIGNGKSVGIGGGTGNDGSNSVSITGGTVYAYGALFGIGGSYIGSSTFTISEDLTVVSGKSAGAMDLVEHTSETNLRNSLSKYVAISSNQEPINYYDENGNEKTLYVYTVVDENTNSWLTSWYVVNSDVTISGGLTCNRETVLVLVDEKTMNVGGIKVADGGSLTIYGQKDGTGTLNSVGVSGYAGIGPSNITINGGVINATGDLSCAGIGGFFNGTGIGKNIIINNGTVTATGGVYSAGIGGRSGCSCGDITINGGTVIANGTKGGAGIGDGYNARGTTGPITINGGVVIANGSAYQDNVADGIGSSGDALSDNPIINIGAELSVKAGKAANPTAVIKHTSEEDLYTKLHGRQYVTVGGTAAPCICKIGEYEYESIADALSETPTGEDADNPTDIILLSNRTENIQIGSGRYITLDLNGYVFSGEGSTSVITNNGTLTIISTENSEAETHYFTYNTDAAWSLLSEGGYEGAVNYDDMDTATLIDGETVIAVSGGCIAGGTGTLSQDSQRGGGIYNTGTLNLQGGYVIGNTAGGGVYFGSGSMTVGGTATITGNALADGSVIGNLLLAANTSLTIEAGFAGDIGVTMEGGTGAFTDAGCEDYQACFFADDSSYTVSKGTDNRLSLLRVISANDFRYTAPADLTYDGRKKEAQIDTTLTGVGTVTVKYYDSEDALLSDIPVNAGTYTVKIDAAEGSACAAAENLTQADWTFTVLPKSMEGCTLGDIAIQTYTGVEIQPELTVADDGTSLVQGTDYSVSYANNINLGTATVTINGLGNYTGTLTKEFWIARPVEIKTVNPENSAAAVDPESARQGLRGVIEKIGLADTTAESVKGALTNYVPEEKLEDMAEEIAQILTDEEPVSLAVNLKQVKADALSPENQALLDQHIPNESSQNAQCIKVANLDLSVELQSGSKTLGDITRFDEKISVSVELTEEQLAALANDSVAARAKAYVMGIRDGKIQLIPATRDNNTLRFTADQPSLFTVVILTYTPGDVNNDSFFNVKDILHLINYITGNAVTVNLAAADVNCDCQTNLLDLVRMMRKLCDVSITLN